MESIIWSVLGSACQSVATEGGCHNYYSQIYWH